MNKMLVLAATVALAVSTSATAQRLKFVQVCNEPTRQLDLEQISYDRSDLETPVVVSRSKAVFGCFNTEPFYSVQAYGYRLTGLRADERVAIMWISKSGNGRYEYPAGEESVSLLVEKGMDMFVYLVKVPTGATASVKR